MRSTFVVVGVDTGHGLVEPSPAQYPVDGIASKIRAALDDYGSVIVVAPPGTGKTTRLPLLLAGRGRPDRLIVTEPRRVATRAAASRMAWTLGERVGQTVGSRTREETNVSALTRIEVVTEGVFLRMIHAGPGLEGVSTVLFDEVHERSLDIDVSNRPHARCTHGLAAGPADRDHVGDSRSRTTWCLARRSGCIDIGSDLSAKNSSSTDARGGTSR